ncbi:hypothetical protein [Aquisphaera insulae]|uniref:hypothetical protein n=1 Tax=Aquisphaera insulae TaxID=2712864 RepID=UPI0013EA5B62|nr:hypothetical protein [Aquisphaera insulae]
MASAIETATAIGTVTVPAGISFGDLHRMTVDRDEQLAASGVLDDPRRAARWS